MDWQAFWLTVRLATLVAAVLLVVGLPVAYWITYSRWRWKFLAEAVFALPIVLPPTVLGFYVLVALGPHSPLGRGWEALTGHTLAFTFEGLLIGSILYSFPFAVQPFAASFAAVDPRLMAASQTLGVSRFKTFFRVILPLSLPGLVTGLALSFAHCHGFSAAGNLVRRAFGRVRPEPAGLGVEVRTAAPQRTRSYTKENVLRGMLALIT